MKQPVFIGAATAIVTPFSDGLLDQESYLGLLRLQAESEVNAIVVCGTTGEASTLSSQERKTLYHLTHTYLNGKKKWIAGIGTNSTSTSIALAKEAQEAGADALLAVTPYYNKCTQNGLIEHYTAIADSTDLPLILYNVPSRTGVDISPESCKILSQHPRINGIKEAGGSISKVLAIRSLCGNQLHIWSGNDDQTVPIMALGGKGVISVLSNLCPNRVAKLCKACLIEDYRLASQLQCKALPLIKQLFCEVNPIPVKAALASWHLCKNELRLPLTTISEANKHALIKSLSDYLAFPGE